MLRPLAGFLALTVLGIASAGCASSPPPPPPKPPGVPPSPRSITVAHPGGDAADPELAALTLLDRATWWARRDRYNTLSVQLSDARHWQRVTLWGYPTRVAFRFGDEHYGIVAVWYEPSRGPDDPESCLQRFIAGGRSAAEVFGVHAAEVRLVHTLQADARSARPMVVDVIDASYDDGGDVKEYAGALAAYSSWPGTCLLQGFVVVAGKHRALAQRIRDRWVAEGAPRLAWHSRVTAAPAFESR